MSKEKLTIGIHDQLPAEHYHRADGVSSSTLKEMGRSPAHCKALMDGKRIKSSTALSTGTLLHTAVLEPDLFNTAYCKKPTTDGYPDALVSHDDYKAIASKLGLKLSGSKADLKDRIKEADKTALFFDDLSAEQSAGKTIISDSDWQLCQGVIQSVRLHDKASKALSGGIAERSVVWTDSITQEKCKARFDYYREDLGIIFDLKTCQDARQWAAQRDIHKYGYHISAAMYLAGAQAAGLPATSFAWLFVEKEPPYAIGLYMASPAMMEQGFIQFRTWLDQYHQCQQSGIWPGYASEFQTIELPGYAA
ncbi:PD-(D/E)XK nuclease-like domain-containing protein [Endozoicomonas sp. Mp262]|uniref:PD-(D/E)XK nuclease-like domain-containing protein n=1 Tax=Endozoicomonas sp. Mp262 TaxID=2919499 RepID=UPI0021D84580